MRASTRSLKLQVSEIAGLSESRLVDVRFDGHRVWSVRLPEPSGRTVTVQWPRALREKLRGETELAIHDTTTGELLVKDDVRFGGRNSGRVSITDKRGQWLAMTKWDRLGPVIEGSDDNVADRLLADASRLVADLERWGYPVYVVGGTLLGVIRNGGMLPHDDDIDFAFLSDATNPADLGLVSFEMVRKLRDAGYTVARHSLAQLEIVFFDEDHEIDHYVDIFTGFFRDGLYCQPFALRGPEVTREDLVPTKPMSVNGVDLPAPANPEAWLRYAYGENWRVPDPTFVFEVSSGTKARFHSWFGIFNRGRFFWEKYYQGRVEPELPEHGAEDVTEFLSMIPEGSNILDLGCGDGALSKLMADAGHRVVAVDFAYEGLRVARQLESDNLSTMRVNINDRIALFELAAQMIQTKQVWHVFLRDTIHGLTQVNRDSVFMFLAAVLRGNGIAYVTFDDTTSPNYLRVDPRSWVYKRPTFVRDVAIRGLEVIDIRRDLLPGLRPRTVAILNGPSERVDQPIEKLLEEMRN